MTTPNADLPAVTEGEVRLTDFDVATLSDLFEANRFDRLTEAVERILTDRLTATRDRLRAVEAERDAAVATAEGRLLQVADQRARAESAEAAHAALVAGVEALAEEWQNSTTWDGRIEPVGRAYGRALADRLLPTSDREGDPR